MSKHKGGVPDPDAAKSELEMKMALGAALPWLGGGGRGDRAEYRRLGQRPLGDSVPRILLPDPASRLPRQSGTRRHPSEAQSSSRESISKVERVCASLPLALSRLGTLSVPNEVFERMREGGVGLPPDSPVFSILARARLEPAVPAETPLRAERSVPTGGAEVGS